MTTASESSGPTLDDPGEADMVLACLLIDALAHLDCLGSVPIGTNDAILVLRGHLHPRSNGLRPVAVLDNILFRWCRTEELIECGIERHHPTPGKQILLLGAEVLCTMPESPRNSPQFRPKFAPCRQT